MIKASIFSKFCLGGAMPKVQISVDRSGHKRRCLKHQKWKEVPVAQVSNGPPFSKNLVKMFYISRSNQTILDFFMGDRVSHHLMGWEEWVLTSFHGKRGTSNISWACKVPTTFHGRLTGGHLSLQYVQQLRIQRRLLAPLRSRFVGVHFHDLN